MRHISRGEEPEGNCGWSVVDKGERGERCRGEGRQTVAAGPDEELDLCSNCEGRSSTGYKQKNNLL